MRAVIFVVRLADLALETCPDLGADTHPVSDLDGRHLGADLDGLADNLVSDAERQMRCSPSAGDGVDITAADATGMNLDVDVVVLKGLWLELSWVLATVSHTNESMMKRG